jgi:hypothetical protein
MIWEWRTIRRWIVEIGCLINSGGVVGRGVNYVHGIPQRVTAIVLVVVVLFQANVCLLCANGVGNNICAGNTLEICMGGVNGQGNW